MFLEACMHRMANAIVEMAEGLEGVIMQSDIFDQSMESVRFQVIVAYYFPEFV